MKKRQLLAIGCALMVCGSLLGGCGGTQKTEADGAGQAQDISADAQDENPEGEDESAGAETADSSQAGDKHVNAALYWFGTSLDPAVEYDGWTLMRVGAGETLVTVDGNLNIVGQLADSWEMVDDVTWKMHIRDGVTFHNGKPVDAEAVKKSFERVMELQERGKTAAKIADIQADGQEITFVTEEPFGAFLANLTEPIYTVIDVDSGTDPQSQPIATGPFMITSFTRDVEIQTARYEDYWGGASDIATMTTKCITDDSTRALALQSGDVDIVQRISATDLPVFESGSDFNVYDTQGTRMRVMVLNHKNEFLSDLNVRKALECAIDYDAVAKSMGAGVTPSGAPYPESAPYGFQELDRQAYDASKAAQCLADAGFEDSDGNGYVEKNGKELALTISYSDATMTTVCEAIQYMAAQAGIRIDLDFRESTSDLEAAKEFDILVKNWQTLSTGDPQWLLDTMYKTDAPNNFGNYSNPRLDEICDRMTTAFDLEDRTALAIEAENLILEDSANIMLVTQNNFVVASSKVKNVVPYPIDYYFVTKDLTIE